MALFVAMIRDDDGRGVRADRIDAWAPVPFDWTRVYLSGGEVIDLEIPTPKFVERLDRALTALADAEGGD